jgi:hypothetical protein
MAFDPMLGWVDRVRLRDGRAVLIRPACRSDAELVQAFVRGLSAASRYERFFVAFRELPPSLLQRIVEPIGNTVMLVALHPHVCVAEVGLAQRFSAPAMRQREW